VSVDYKNFLDLSSLGDDKQNGCLSIQRINIKSDRTIPTYLRKEIKNLNDNRACDLFDYKVFVSFLRHHEFSKEIIDGFISLENQHLNQLDNILPLIFKSLFKGFRVSNFNMKNMYEFNYPRFILFLHDKSICSEYTLNFVNLLREEEYQHYNIVEKNEKNCQDIVKKPNNNLNKIKLKNWFDLASFKEAKYSKDVFLLNINYNISFKKEIEFLNNNFLLDKVILLDCSKIDLNKSECLECLDKDKVSFALTNLNFKFKLGSLFNELKKFNYPVSFISEDRVTPGVFPEKQILTKYFTGLFKNYYFLSKGVY